MTTKEILADLNSPRVKKVIVDSDFAAEVDDQYALAYAMGSDKMEVLSVNAVAHFDPPQNGNTRQTVLRSFCELGIVLDALGIDINDFPAYKGQFTQITNSPGFAPPACDSADNIINISKQYSDEIIYVLTTGPCSSAVTAWLKDKSISKNICVVWLGSNCIHETTGSFHEWNLYSDYAAAQILMDSDLGLIMLPCDPYGSVKIVMTKDDLNNIQGDSYAANFFRRDLMLRVCRDDSHYDNIRKVMCDFAAPAVIAMPDCMELTEVTAPVLTDDGCYAYDRTRRKILYGVRPDSQRIVDDAIAAINNLIAKYA